MASHTTDETLSEDNVIKFTSGQAIVEERSLEWKIENFLVIKSFKDLSDEQHFDFEAGESHGYSTKWNLELKAKSELKQFGIFLRLKTALPNFRTIATCSFQNIKQNGESCELRKFERKLFTQTARSWGFYGFFPEDDDDLEELIWEDGSVIVKVDFKLFLFKGTGLPNVKDFQEELDGFEKRELQKLSQSLTRMIDLDGQPDLGKIIKVVSKDQVIFYASTATLSARSPVFEAMFDSGKWKEGQGSEGGKEEGNSLVLEDLSGKTVKVLLHFLIGGVLLREDWKAEDVILELTWAAQKYQLEGLTEFLDKVLPGVACGAETLAKLALLTKRLGMKNAEKGLLSKLKETATDIDQLLLDKEGSLLGGD